MAAAVRRRQSSSLGRELYQLSFLGRQEEEIDKNTIRQLQRDLAKERKRAEVRGIARPAGFRVEGLG